jgi:hypothetical protein
MVKRLSALLLASVLATSLQSQIASSANFSTGALLNQHWTCIKPNTGAVGPISDSKFAELELAPSSIKREKTYTTANFTSMELRNVKGIFTSLSLLVFKGTKTYKQSFISIKGVEGPQKISFSVKVPTADIQSIVFNISLENTKVSKSGGACIPTTVYNGLLPTGTPPRPVDPVLQKISQRLLSLGSVSPQVNPGLINWVLSPNVPSSYKAVLEQQNNELFSAFPKLFRWDGKALIVVGDVLKWTPSSVDVSNSCMNFVQRLVTMWSPQPHLNERLLGGASYCDGHPVVVIRPNPSATGPDPDLIAQEIGGMIQVNAIHDNPRTSTLSMDDLRIPDWYMQGGQSVNAFIAGVFKSKSMAGAFSKAYLSPECATISLAQMRPEVKSNLGQVNCDYNKGFVATQLMVALYGWDATTRWFSGFTTGSDYESAFNVAFGKTLTEFESLADVYWKYLYDSKTDISLLQGALQAAN